MTTDRGWQGTMIGVTLETQKFWDEEADTFDDKADHDLRDAAVRGAWSRLVLPLLPDVPARVADLGCGTGSLSVLVAQAGYDDICKIFVHFVVRREARQGCRRTSRP